MINEYDQIVLKADVPGEGLRAGDVGTVVHIYQSGKGFEVEFFTLTGETITVVTLDAAQVREISEKDVPHDRPMEAAA